MALDYEPHLTALERTAKLAFDTRKQDAEEFIANADKASDIIVKTEIARTAGLVQKIKAVEEKESFLS